MQHLKLPIVAVLLVLGALPATGQHHRQEGASRDISEAEARDAIALIYLGRPHEAIAMIESLREPCNGEPLYLLTRVRVMRELLPLDDEDKKMIRRVSAPLHAELDRVIEVCTRRMDQGDEDPRLLLYRGWARMYKSQLKSFARSFWSAGRDAGKGKKDLARYLKLNPDDSTADGIMSAFLYFADTIPSAFKFISKLLFLPSGDRERGLAGLERASHGGGLLEADQQVLLCSVYILFEGRYEDGLRGFRQIRTRYPEYMRLGVAMSVLHPLMPRGTGMTDDEVDNTIYDAYGKDRAKVDWGMHALLRYTRAYSDRFYGDPDVAEARLQRLAMDPPEHPDWVEPFARLELGRLLASRGRFAEARTLFQSILDTKQAGYAHGEARKMMRDLDHDPVPSGLIHDQWIRDIYHGDATTRDNSVSQLDQLVPPNLQSIFYVGEGFLLNGQYNAALESYLEVLRLEVPAWDESYQMLAASRAAEIFGSRGDYRSAARYLDRAMQYYHKEFFVDWLLQGRKRYYDRLADGKETGGPSLYSATPR